ncbi:metal ABC transporter substrate-binding protein [Prochlorococcus marinus]|uniref:metal ABC transporter substrate-binding protein n=1 Tax=Prochlorococcus marinus TaxID=1219 RepID=UPI002FBEA7CF
MLLIFNVSCKPLSSNKDQIVNPSKLIVLTTFTVLADIAKNIAGERLIVESITKPGAEIHGYKPTPSDLVRASKADLIVENGLGLELWAKKFTSSLNDVSRVVLTDGINPLPIEGDVYAGRPNPHAWMSPLRAIHYVDKLASAFISIDHEGKEVYLKNSDIYKKKLIDLDQELRTALEKVPLEKRVLVSCEGALSYLADDYGFQEAYLWPVNAESQVTPRRMEKLIATISKTQVPVVFCETTVSEKPQLEVSRITQTTFGGKFFVDSLSDKDGPAPTFIDLQRHNVRLILKGFAVNN